MTATRRPAGESARERGAEGHSAAARHFVVVPAAGGGARFGADVPKQYAELGGRPLLGHTLDRLRHQIDIRASFFRPRRMPCASPTFSTGPISGSAPRKTMV